MDFGGVAPLVWVWMIGKLVFHKLFDLFRAPPLQFQFRKASQAGTLMIACFAGSDHDGSLMIAGGNIRNGFGDLKIRFLRRLLGSFSYRLVESIKQEQSVAPFNFSLKLARAFAWRKP